MRTRGLVVLIALSLSACGSSGGAGGSSTAGSSSDQRPVVTIGTKNFTEQFILGEIYAQALRAEGFRVRLKQNIGPSEIVDRTLVSGQIDMYPEYTGVAAVVLAGSKTQPKTASATY